MGDPYFSFDVAAFRLAYPAFADASKFSDATLEAYWSAAGNYIANENYGTLRDDSRLLGLNLMTAHLAQLSVQIAAGQNPALAQSSTIDKVSVTMTPPPIKSQFAWWLCLTAYGAQLFALLSARSAGGFFIGGSITRGGFRGNAGFGS